MARSLLTGLAAYAVAWAAGSSVGACRKHEAAPTPIPDASASSSRAFSETKRAGHFETEVQRSTRRWAEKPSLAECTSALPDSTDAELCNDAARSLASIEGLAPSAPVDRWLAALADGSLALARLSQRVRYQSLVELGQVHVTGDAGVAAVAPRVAGKAPAVIASTPHALRAADAPHALKLSEGPAARFLPSVLRLERDMLRHLAAYLEYAPLSGRQQALETVKKLRKTRAQWPLLDSTIREAALLEKDPELKRSLDTLIASALPSGQPRTVDQAGASK